MKRQQRRWSGAAAAKGASPVMSGEEIARISGSELSLRKAGPEDLFSKADHD